MDAISASGHGFDEALKALEDLETSVAPPHGETPAAAGASLGGIGFYDEELEGEAVAIMAAPTAEIDLIVPDIVVETRAERPSSPAPAPVPVATAPAPVAIEAVVASAPSRMLKITVGLALVSSIVSAAGLVVAERTIMSAQLVVADARERAEQLEKANTLIRDLEIVRARQVELLQAQQAQLASAPVSSAELQHRMESLQAGLVARDPLNNVVAAIRAGQTDTTARFNEFSMKMARLEKAVEGR